VSLRRDILYMMANTTDLLLSRIAWLDNIGRSSRSNKNEKLENFLTDLQRLTIVHEKDKDGLSQYRFSSKGANEEDGDEEKPKEKGKDEKDKDKKGKGKEENDAGKKDGAEGDKSMSDQHGVKGAHEEKRVKDRDANPKDKDGNEAAQGGRASEV
jgi:H+-transporting ATPase